jgi:hypothetical protein
MADKEYRHKPQGPKERRYLGKLYAFRDKIKRGTKKRS